MLWVNKKLMKDFGYTVPTTWQEWATLGEKVAKEHPGYIVGNMGESFSHWIYLWGNQCPLQQVDGEKVPINAADEHCTRTAKLLDPLIKDGPFRHSACSRRTSPRSTAATRARS